MARSCDTPSHPSPIIRILAQPRRVKYFRVIAQRMSATTCYFAWGCFSNFSWDVHCEERALAGVSKDGHKRDRSLRPSFETPATPVIGPRYAPTRWRAPQDKVHRQDWFHASDRPGSVDLINQMVERSTRRR